MLDISRIESGIARAKFEPVNFVALVDECVNLQQAEALRRRIALSVSRRSAGTIAPADHDVMKQVMLNLLSNALKYTPDGGAIAVEVDIDNLARSVVVSVRDNGLGVPEHALRQLFGKFYRVEGHERWRRAQVSDSTCAGILSKQCTADRSGLIPRWELARASGSRSRSNRRGERPHEHARQHQSRKQSSAHPRC